MGRATATRCTNAEAAPTCGDTHFNVSPASDAIGADNLHTKKDSHAAAGDARDFNVKALPTPARGGRAGRPPRSERSSNQQHNASSSCGDRRGGRSDRINTPLEDVMRRKGIDEAWNALEDMQRQGVLSDKYTISRMLMKTVGDSRSRLNPARAYRGINLVEKFIESQPKDVDEVLFNAILDICCRLRDMTRLESTVSRMRELKVVPSSVTLGILVKTYGQAGDLSKVLQVWEEMENQRIQANAVTYGCMIDACVKNGNLPKAVEIFEGMRQDGKHKNTILYTTLIKGHGSDKDLSSALNLFYEMKNEGVPYNAITYNSIIDACIKCGDISTAEGLLADMISPENPLEPDLITFSTLLKGYCHVGNLDKALQVAEAIKARNMKCDGLVYNTLMDGCVKVGDTTVGIGLFDEMLQSGLRPTPITHSILTRLFQKAGCEEDAVEAVAQLYMHHGLERPSGMERNYRVGGRSSCSTPAGYAHAQSPGWPSPNGANASPCGVWDPASQQSYFGAPGQMGWTMPMMSPIPTPCTPPMQANGQALSIDALLAAQNGSGGLDARPHLTLPSDIFSNAGLPTYQQCATTPMSTTPCGGSTFSTTPIGAFSPFMMGGMVNNNFFMGTSPAPNAVMMQVPPMPPQPTLAPAQTSPAAAGSWCGYSAFGFPTLPESQQPFPHAFMTTPHDFSTAPATMPANSDTSQSVLQVTSPDLAANAAAGSLPMPGQ